MDDDFICSVGEAVSFPVIAAIDIFLPECPPLGSMVAGQSVDLGSGFPLFSLEVTVASFCLCMDFQDVLIRNRGRVSETLLACCWDGLSLRPHLTHMDQNLGLPLVK